MSKQVLGILMKKTQLSHARKGKSYEKINLYIKAAKKYDIDVCFLCLSDINDQNGTTLAYFKNNQTWLRRRISIPKVIHNRVKLINLRKNKFKEIERRFGVTFYNSWNNYSKFQIHNIIYKNPLLRKVLPTTHQFSKNNLLLYLNYPSFLLKPDRGSLGKGIIKVNKHSSKMWEVHYLIKRRKKIRKIQKEHLFLFLSKCIGKEKYILQETINLHTYHKRPFDIRVSVQRSPKEKLKVTGMVGKVAAKGSFLSNVYQGGSTVRFESLFPINTQIIRRNLSQISLDIVQHLNQYIPLIADVGLDFGVDKSGKPFFIEVNFRDQRYSFLSARMKHTFHLTYDTPVGYGAYLLNR